MRRVVVVPGVVLTAILLFAGGGWLYMKFGMRGFSARAEPSHMEAMMAEYLPFRSQRRLNEFLRRAISSQSLLGFLLE